MKRCKAKRNGARCRREAQLCGYCFCHFTSELRKNDEFRKRINEALDEVE